MFNKDEFKNLLIKAQGKRTITEYADESGVNRTYLSKYINNKLENPPSPGIIKRLSSKAHNGVTYEELMIAAGHLKPIPLISEQKGHNKGKPKEIDELLQGEVYFCGEPITEEDLAPIREFSRLYLKTLKQSEMMTSLKKLIKGIIQKQKARYDEQTIKESLFTAVIECLPDTLGANDGNENQTNETSFIAGDPLKRNLREYIYNKTFEVHQEPTPKDALKSIIAYYGELAIIEAFTTFMKENNLAIANGRPSNHFASTGNSDLDHILSSFYALCATADDDMKGWIKVQFSRAFPADVVDQAQKKLTEKYSEKSIVG